MGLSHLKSSTLIHVTKSALKFEILLTATLAILGSVVLFGLFGLGGDDSFVSILGDFLAVSLSSLWLMLGFVALAHQINVGIIAEEEMPFSTQAYAFAWQRIKAIILLPAWGVAGLLMILLGEILLLSLANIPGLGTVWLAFIMIPLLVFNTLLVILLILSVFNIAAYVAVSESTMSEMRHELWALIKQKFVELLVYNLGGLLLTLVIAALVLSPLWLGAQATLILSGYAAGDAWASLIGAEGFWGGIAYFVGLVMSGLLVAVIGTIPITIITHITLLVHLELLSGEQEQASSLSDSEEIESETKS